MEYTAVKMFAQLTKRQRQHGVELWLIGMTPRVCPSSNDHRLGSCWDAKG